MNTHLKGLIITTIGVLFIVPDSLFVRLLDQEPMVTAFWRSLNSGVLILLALLVFQGPDSFRPVLRTGAPGIAYIVLFASTAPAFVMAVTHTSVANVVLIFAAMPIFATIFGRLFLNEEINSRMILTMVAVGVGLGIIAYGTSENAIASLKGDLFALYVCAAYAAALTAVRQVKDISMVPAVPIAYIGAALVLWPFADPMNAFENHWLLFLCHGTFIAIGTCFLTLGPRYISSAEVSLLILLESVLAPLLVWAWIGEDPGRWALVGGAVVVGALVVSNLFVLMRTNRLR